jgi:hypothetical protein
MSSSIDSLLPAAVSLLILVPILGSFIGLGTYIIIVVANRADPDPTGKRPIAVYMFAASFVSLWLAYTGAVVIVASLVNLIGTHVSYFPSQLHPYGDAAVRGVTVGGLLVVVAGILHELHRRRGLDLADSETDPASPTKRVARSYVSAVSFISIFILLITLITALYTAFGEIAPGVYQASGRLDPFKSLLDQVFVIILSLVIFSYHQHLAPKGLRLIGSRPRPTVDVFEAPTTPSEPAASTETTGGTES